MKILIACAVTLVTVLAEPPIDNRYLPPQQGFSGGGGGFPPPSQSYGAPGAGGYDSQRQTDAVFRGRPSSNYDAPSSRSSYNPGSSRQPSNQYGSPNQPSDQYGPPQRSQPAFGTRQPSNQYGSPSESSNRFGSSQPSNQYGAPAFGPLGQQSSSIGSPSSQYGSTQMNRQGGFGRQRPGVEYGAPSNRPSQEYGAPGAGSFGGSNQYSNNEAAQSRQYLPPGGDRGGHGDARGGYGGDDEGNREPANYNFEYMVKDDESGNDFGHRESRQGDITEGVYYVVLPDGRKQTVEYEADQNGYRPKISYEDVGTAGGYDRNSQRSGSGYQNGYQNGGGGGGPY